MKDLHRKTTDLAKHHSVRAKILPLLFIAIIFLQGAFLVAFWRARQQELAELKETTSRQVQDLFREEMERDVAKMGAAMEVIVRDSDLLDAFKNRDRDGLVRQAQPVFRRFRREYQITHFYFHQPDRLNFLRLHDEKKGDYIARTTIAAAERTGQPSAGLEQGQTGNPVLRLVYPWRSDFPTKSDVNLFSDRTGNLVGYLELGIEFEDIAKNVREILDVDLIVVVDKAFLDRQRWENRNKKLGQQSDWNEFPDYVVVDKTVSTVPNPIARAIADEDLSALPDLHVPRGNQTFQTLFLPFRDIDERELGYVVVLKDISAILVNAERNSWIAIAVSVVVGASAIFFVYIFLGKVERDLNERTRELALATEELAFSKEKLEAYDRALEQKVEARTTELQENNRQLEQTLQVVRTVQAQLLQAKMSSLSQFVAGVAREIDNPVSFIASNIERVRIYAQHVLNVLQIYRKQYPEPSESIQMHLKALDVDFVETDFPEVLNSMKVGSDRIRDIVLSLQTFSRLDETTLKRVSIHAGLDSTLALLQTRLQNTENRPEVRVIKEYGELPLVECHASQIERVFIHLLTNAIDAFDRGADNTDRLLQLTIRTTCLENSIRVSIADNGPGMTEEVRAKIFEPFFTTKPTGQGMGLGLTASAQIVRDRHGGKLTCESSLGRGTTFHIELPIDRVAGVGLQEGDSPEESAVSEAAIAAPR